MAERHENPSNESSTPVPEVRPPAPHRGGPLSSSGAAPETPAAAADSAAADAPAAGSAADASAADAPAADAPAADASAADAPASGGDADASPLEDKAAAEAPPVGDKPGAAAPVVEKADESSPEPAAAEATKDGDAPKPGEAEGGDKKDGDGTEVQIDLDKATVTTAGASGRRVTRVLRRANPIKAARSAGRSTSAWAKKPVGRLLVPAIAAALLIGGGGAAGAYLVPRALDGGPAPSRSPGFPLDQAAGAPVVPSGGPASQLLPSGGTGFSTQPIAPNPANPRPADALQNWAQGVGTRVGIPVVAVQAYGYAELIAARNAPNCHLSWTTIAAIAKVESAHGSSNGAVLNADGSVQPPIFGLPLDGKGGRELIRDTDQGTIDGDTTFDRAVGPLQFIPATWLEMQKDADNSGAADPNDIDDASLAAALYLCKDGRDLAKADAWWEAILSYNAVRPYAQKVFDAANEYGQRSRV